MLTDRQRLFVERYLITLNATLAAIEAGYAQTNARQQGAENLSKPNIRAAIREGIAQRIERTKIDQDFVVERLAAIGAADLRRVVTWGENGLHPIPSDLIDDQIAGAIVEVAETQHGFRVKMADKIRALELLARHLGMFDGPGQATDSSVEIAREIKGALRAMTVQTHGGNEGDSIPFWARGGMNTIQPSDNGGDSNGADGK